MHTDRSISFEIRLTACTLVFTLVATALFLRDIASSAAVSSLAHWFELVGYTVIIAFLIYGNVGYQLTRIGHLQRSAAHRPGATRRAAGGRSASAGSRRCRR